MWLALVFAAPVVHAAAPAAPAAAVAAASSLAEPQDNGAHVRRIKQILLARRMRTYYEEIAEREAMYREDSDAGEASVEPPGEHLRPAPYEPPFLAPREPQTLPADLSSLAVVPANTRVNDPFPDAANATQSEIGLASAGTNVLVAWNDGQALVSGGDFIGYGFSTNGGATYKDGGTPPHPAAYPTWRWTSDPSVSVNEKTGRFFLAGTASVDASTNAIGIAYAHFSDTLLVWDNAVAVATSPNGTAFLDKPWIVADSSGPGTSVYITNTRFTSSSDRIDFRRSTDGGDTWSAGTQISNALDNGYVHGSRPVVGPAGELYAIWEADRPDTSFDHLKIRKSVDRGVSFAAEVIITNYFRNDGTGAPGFNRPLGISFPSIAVDRTLGPNRGRVYVVWNESYDWIDNNLFGGSIRNEIEPNNAASTAQQFTPGEIIRGTTSYVLPTSAPDIDWWKFTLQTGQSIIVWVDSLVSGQTYSLRIQAPGSDSSQRLAYSGDENPSDGVDDHALYTFTAPISGTYYLRYSPLSGSLPGGGNFTGVTGDYRIRTRLGNVSGRGRDQRDIFASASANGTTWSPPKIVNDDGPGFDNFLPEVAVSAEGMPYVQWFDFRDDVYGSRTHQYLSRSAFAGLGWDKNQRVTSGTSNFTLSGSNLEPNMGDYNRMWGDERWLRSSWGDARSTSVDVWTMRLDASVVLGRPCPPDTSVAANRVVLLDTDLVNSNLFTNSYKVKVTSQRNWPLPDSQVVAVLSGTSASLPVSVLIPDTAAVGTNQVCLVVTNASGLPSTVCCRTVTITPKDNTTDAGPPALEFALRPVAPNPASGRARIAFSLARPGWVKLTVFGLRGERVRQLVNGARNAGSASLEWNGRDDAGGAVPAGVYFVRLETAGQSAVRRLMWLR